MTIFGKTFSKVNHQYSSSKLRRRDTIYFTSFIIQKMIKIDDESSYFDNFQSQNGMDCELILFNYFHFDTSESVSEHSTYTFDLLIRIVHTLIVMLLFVNKETLYFRLFSIVCKVTLRFANDRKCKILFSFSPTSTRNLNDS